MSETPNPFMNRGVITDPNDFFGREEQVNEIFTRLQGMQSSSIVGERRIGKSSLLYCLIQTGPQRLGDESRFFYLDIQDAHFHTAVGFLQTVLSKVGGAIESIKAGNTLNQNLIAFSDEIDALEQAGQRIVLCLDEFEKLAFVTATQQPLQTLSIEGQLTSPFYTLFTVVELKELTETQAQQFVAAQHEKVHFSDTELEFIFSELQLHPLKLQILCDLGDEKSPAATE